MSSNIFTDTLRGIKRERPPVWFMRQAGRVLPSYMQLREKYSFQELMGEPELAAKVTLLPVNDLGVDAAILFSDILVIPEALGMKLEFTDQGPKFETPLQKDAGAYKNLTADLSKLEHIYKALDIIREEKTEDVALIGFCGSPFTTFCYMVEGHSVNHSFSKAIDLLYSQPEISDRILEIITDLSITYATEQCNHGIDVFQLFETHAGLLPSEVYRKRILPHVIRITSAIRRSNVPVIFFPKGLGNGLKWMNPDMADFISIDWQHSLADAREIIDPALGLQGNLDPRLLSVEDRKVLERELESYKAFGKSNYKWIFNTGHGLSPDNKVDHVRFVVDWVKGTDWGRFPG